MTPDQLLLAGLGAIGIAGYLAYATGSVNRERRPVPVTRPSRPLACGRLVQIDAGPDAGLAGWVYEMATDRAGRQVVKVRLQLDDRIVVVDRSNVSALFG